ncbi:MAG: hypothetical protein GX657_02830 [Chloroflexi bacterium]|nr:hypothetical protein [Chloroflexota bacterium]
MVHALPPADGYRGIWYYNQPSGDEYVYKYSGGFATYPQQHVPIAHYRPEVHRTFFVYGGVAEGTGELLHMVSYYDHASGTVPRPRILLNKHTDDAHDNPTLSIDAEGYLWVFSNAHGTSRPSYIHRSARPYDITAFERVAESNFSYGQPWHIAGQGFLFLHTRYAPGRYLHWMTSPDGTTWSAPQLLAGVCEGHYQVSWQDGQRVGTAFNYHPDDAEVNGLNARTNLYYVETRDLGNTWMTAAGRPVTPPILNVLNEALVHDYRAEGLLVYLKDIAFDTLGHPVILFITSKGYRSGPANDPRTWTTARWTGSEWAVRPVTTSDNNYDYGPLYIEPDGLWRIIAPTEPGPQRYNPGGEVAMWTSRDQGEAWSRIKQLTTRSAYNHTYMRKPVNAHPDFYALWADGHARQPSESHLYFTDRDGSHVWRLPRVMPGEVARPDVAW